MCGSGTIPQEMLRPKYRIETGVLKDYTGCVDIQEAVIPEGVVKIERGGIPPSVSRIVMPESLREIGPYACNGFLHLQQISFPAGVTHIGQSAFQNCGSLTCVVLPPNLISLGSRAFQGCSGLTSILLPPKLTEIETGAFCQCASLENVCIPPNITEIKSNAFQKCVKLQSIVLPDGLQKIGYEAFCGCTGLRAVKIPDTVKRIEFGAFQNCSALRAISFPPGLESLQKDVLAGSSLEEFDIPDGVMELERGAFSQCVRLRRITIPDSVKKISRYAFAGCTALERVECSDPGRFAGAFLDTPFWRKDHPDAVRPARLPPDIIGNCLGKVLLSRGYAGFEPERMYHIRLPDENGIVEVSSWCGEDEPDEDGYGRENYYDWWYLDEELKAIPGVEVLHSFSNHEKRANPKLFGDRYCKAVQEIKKRTAL